MVALTEVAGRLEQVLERFQHTNSVSIQPPNDQREQAALAESFLLSVKSAAKPGLSMDR